MDNQQEIYNELDNELKKIQELNNNLNEKLEQKIEIQSKINKLENDEQNLKLQITKIRNKKKSILRQIVFNVIYSLALCLILIIFISSFIKKFEIAALIYKTLYIIEIYVGVTAVSILGAYSLAKIGDLRKELLNKKILEISNKIKQKEKEIKIEKQKQEELEKEINYISDILDNKSYLVELKDEEIQKLADKIICNDLGVDNEIEVRTKKYTKVKSKYK